MSRFRSKVGVLFEAFGTQVPQVSCYFAIIPTEDRIGTSVDQQMQGSSIRLTLSRSSAKLGASFRILFRIQTWQCR